MANPTPSTMMPFPLTLGTILDRAGHWFAGVELVARARGDGLERTTYAGLGSRARALAAGLCAAGLQPGDRVATLLWNQMPHLEAYFGVPLAGGIVHPLNLRLHPEQLARILKHAGDRFILVDESLRDLWQKIAPLVPAVRAVHFPGDYEALLAPVAAAEPLPAISDEFAGAAMGYTSGTTGEPKGVIYSHRALVLHAFATALPDAMNLRQSDVVFPLVPMFHANAWGVPYTAVMIGCKQVLAGARFDAESALDLLASEQVTFSAGVGVIWQAVLDALEREPGRWRLHPGLRVNLGGAPAAESLFRRFDHHGIAVNMGWGMTEMTPVGAMNPLWGPDVAGSHEPRTRQGRPLPFVEARTAPPGEPVGELEVRGPWVTASYVGGADPAAFTGDGWFRTGDVVNFNSGGLMAIVDRNKDLIRSGGEWISSVALENALACCPDVSQAAVIAVPHPKWQERPLALVILRPGAAPDPVAWQQHLRAAFAAWQCPEAYVVVEQLPRTATGKLDKRALREQYQDWRWPS